MAGGSFSFSPASRYTPTGQPKFVLNVGLVPEASGSSCSLKSLCKAAQAGYGMEDLAFTDVSTSGGGGGGCEVSSWGRYSEMDGCQVLGYCCDPSSSAAVAGDHLVLETSSSGILMLEAFNATCNSNCASPCISWNGQSSQSLSAYIDANHNLLPSQTVQDPNGLRASYGCHVTSANPSQVRSHKFKPDDASSHNNNNNVMLCEGSGVVDAGFATGNDRDVEVEELESIDDSLLQEGQHKARGEEQTTVKASKRKAAETVKKAPGGEVQSEEKNIRTQNESRIVRVSRMTGGKDRHSKVRTARGLRDRRVRLSVPTAIQFYDLQDRLGYEQPSMAVDWLISAAKTAIDDLPPIADASNITQVTYSNSSPVESAVGSPKESATASVAQVTAHELGVKNGRKILARAVHEHQLPIRATKDSHVGRSGSSSISDANIMGTEYSSKNSLSKLERLKVARERAKKKARNPAAASQVLQSSVAGHLTNVVSQGAIPDESCWGRNGIIAGTSTIQQLWNHNVSCKEHSRQFEHMAAASLSSTSSAASLQQQSSADMLRSSSHQSFDMADFTKQRIVVGNPAHIYFNSVIDHQSQPMQKHLGSTFVSSDVSFATSDHSSRGPLQSNSSCITTTNTLLQKNAFAEASAKVSMLPFLAYDTCMPERFQPYSLDGNAKYELNH